MNNIFAVNLCKSINQVFENLEILLSVDNSLSSFNKAASGFWIAMVKPVLQGLARTVLHLDHDFDWNEVLVVANEVV